MGYKHLIFEFKEKVAKITINCPNISNALNHSIGKEFVHCLDNIRDDDAVRAIIITGAGKNFSSGGDLKNMKASIDGGSPQKDMAKMLEPVYELAVKIRTLEKPVLAAVNGPAMGAGMNLALSCDLIIASKNAVFCESFINVGLIPGMAGTFLLPRYVSLSKASELFFLGTRINADEAKELGIVNKVVAPEKLESVAWDTAVKLANQPTRAIARTKALLNETYIHSLEEHLKIERETQVETSGDADYAEGVNSFFEKHKPDFQGK